MCKPASGIFVKGHKAYWSKFSDSHEQIIEEHKLNADGVKGPNIVRFEITPPNGDMSKPLKDWKYNVDQDTLPSWYDKDDAEKSARLMLKDWAKQKIIVGDNRELRAGEYWVISGTVKAYGNSMVAACGNSTVEAYGNSTVEAYGNSTVETYDNSTVKAYDNSTVKAYGNSTVVTYIAVKAGQIQSASAVLVDRSVNPPVCYVGAQK